MVRPSAEARRREQILTATCTVVAEQGFRSLRVADVASVIGSATGTVHYYFPTKRDLLHAAFEFNFRNSLERRKSILHGDGDPVAKLRAFVDSYVPEGPQTVQAWRVWAELWIEAIHEPDLQKLNDAVYGEWRGIVTSIIHEGQDQGLLVRGDPAVQANMLIGLIDGLAIQVILGSPSMVGERMRAVCQELLDQFCVDVP